MKGHDAPVQQCVVSTQVLRTNPYKENHLLSSDNHDTDDNQSRHCQCKQTYYDHDES